MSIVVHNILLQKREGRKEKETTMQNIKLMAIQICIAGIAPWITIVCHLLSRHVHINPPLLYHIKVCFFVKTFVYSNPTQACGTWAHAEREKGGNKYNKMQKHLSTLSKPVRANRNWSSCSSTTQEIHPLINTFLRKSRCGSSSGVSFPFVKMSQQFISNPKNGSNGLNTIVSALLSHYDLWDRISVYFFGDNKKIQQ